MQIAENEDLLKEIDQKREVRNEKLRGILSGKKIKFDSEDDEEEDGERLRSDDSQLTSTIKNRTVPTQVERRNGVRRKIASLIQQNSHGLPDQQKQQQQR